LKIDINKISYKQKAVSYILFSSARQQKITQVTDGSFCNRRNELSLRLHHLRKHFSIPQRTAFSIQRGYDVPDKWNIGSLREISSPSSGWQGFKYCTVFGWLGKPSSVLKFQNVG
jgi:hypothetical protein